MIHLITGVPGAGKTLRAVMHIILMIKAGRAVFTNIEGLSLSGVLPAPENWMDTPEGSVVVYDEAQRIFPAEGTSGGRSSRPDIAGMETHRHTGHDIILITQHPNLLHAHVRRLVGRHEHVVRAFGWDQAKVYTRDEVIKVDSKPALDRCENEWWKHPKELYAVYQSASMHVSHKRIPRQVYYFGAGLVALVALLMFVAPAFYSLMSGAATKAAMGGDVDRKPVVVAVNETRDNPPEVVMSGCMSNANSCRCWDANYKPIFMPESACRNQMEQPLPRDLSREAWRVESSATTGAPVVAPRSYAGTHVM